MIKDSAYVVVSVFAARGGVVLAGMMISTYLGVEAFAAFYFCHVTANAVASISTIGTLNSLPRYFARLKIDKADKIACETFWALILGSSGIILAAILIVVLPYEVLSIPLPASPEFVAGLTLALGFTFLTTGAANGMMNYGKVSIAAMAQSITLLVVVGIAVFLGEVNYIFIGYIMACLSTLLILSAGAWRALSHRLIGVRGLMCPSHAGSVITYSSPLMLNTALISSGVWLCGRSVINSPGGELQYASIAIGLQWYGLAAAAAGVIAKVALPRLTHSAFWQDDVSSRKTIFTGMCVSVFSSLTVLAFFLIFSDVLLSLYGSSAIGAKETVIIFVCASVLASPVPVISSALVSLKKQLSVSKVIVLWWFTLVIGLAAWAESGPAGVAQAFLLAYSVYFILGILTGYRHGLLRRTY